MNLVYEDNILPEDQYEDFPTETSFSEIHDTIQTIPNDPALDPILPSESASQTIPPEPETSSLLITHDRLIRYKECNWETSDSIRSGSTGNMERYLQKVYAISAPSSSSSESTEQQPSIIESLSKKPKLSVAAQLQQNIL
ncbi:hypothetical protein N7509_000532 [Penicillium cosmopolitanum]|uniref:Uncharacterized protein n=1 Tax=Penicillium cosmopolitanum TaxID=1131564 RepID=A0A9W9WAF9_9EURO|nr:uncharacterized protein N7509_000532 [Penicillium cosmopolitanum]KAJ5413905.1 hypothetical protein N7509_000532 [Penicillium cosmopolitanum]